MAKRQLGMLDVSAGEDRGPPPARGAHARERSATGSHRSPSARASTCRVPRRAEVTKRFSEQRLSAMINAHLSPNIDTRFQYFFRSPTGADGRHAKHIAHFIDVSRHDVHISETQLRTFTFIIHRL